MNKIYIMVLLLLMGGCSPTTNIKTISIEKDSTGKIIKIVETEGVLQQVGNTPTVAFEHFVN